MMVRRMAVMARGLRTGLTLALLCLASGALSAAPSGEAAAEASADLFPAKVQIRHARGFEVSYHGTYKVIAVKGPWPGADRVFRYVLVPRGTPPPRLAEDGQTLVVEVPVKRIVVMSTTFIGHLAALGAEEQVVGVPEFGHVSHPRVRERIARGEVAAVGQGGGVNVERVLELNPGLFLAYILEGIHADAHRTLQDAGMPVVLGGGYVETSPLGRCEWLKFTAMFLNAEARAEAYFAEVEAEYVRLAGLVAGTTRRPTVLVNAPFKDIWHVPGGQSYMARFIADAGGEYLWADNPHTGGVPVSFEAIYARAAEAEFWINPGIWQRLEEGREADARYGLFRPLREGRVFNHNRRLNGVGGDDFWESGSVKPHLILKDLIAIFHPELLPDHAFYWYRKLE